MQIDYSAKVGSGSEKLMISKRGLGERR